MNKRTKISTLRTPFIQRSFFCTLFCFVFFPSQAQFIIDTSTDFDEVSLHPFAKIVKVDVADLTIHEVKRNDSLPFYNLTSNNEDLGFTASHYWIKFAIDNQSSEEKIYFLETCRPIVDHAELYAIQSNEVIQKQVSGDALPFEERTFKNRKTIFKIVLKPRSSNQYYLHLKSDGEVINAGITLRTTENLMQTIAFEQLIFGLFYGILLIAAIIYLFFFFAIRERSFLYYSLYVLFIGMLQFSLDGMFFQFITPQSGWLSLNSVILSACIANFFLGRYAQVFLKIDKYSPFIKYSFYTLYVLDLALFISLFVHPGALAYSYPLANVLGLLLLLLIIASVVVIYIKTQKIDRFFATGIFFLVAGFVVFILKNFSVLPVTFWTENGSKLGTGLEVIFLSLSMANLIRKLRNDRESLQAIALQKSEEMNEMKSYFLSNISHELRTPLNTIVNLSKEISNETQEDLTRKNSLLIKDSSFSLLSSVNDILDFSKIEKGTLQLEHVPFELQPILDQLVANTSYRAKVQGLEFTYLPASNLPKKTIGDPLRLSQILSNVLNNAIKFTSKGQVLFEIKCSANSDTKVDLQFTISDTGIGIPKEKMHFIFESFSQESINNKRKYGGLGLGLYLVKTLTDKHHGTVELNSAVGEGTVCKITLTYESVFEVEAQTAPETVAYDLKGNNILVVEDNAMNQMVLKMITKKWQNTAVTFTNNGLEALEALQKQSFAIVLMDLQMPVMDGYEATLAIRNGEAGIQNQNLPIIAVTADVMDATKERVFELGMNGYVSKPIDKELLFKTIVSLV